MKNVVIVGVTGFFGRALAKVLLSQKVKVYGIGRHYCNMDFIMNNPFFIKIEADISKHEDIKRIKSILAELKVDSMYYLAWDGGFTEAITDYKRQLENVICAGSIAELAVAIECKRFVYAGSYNEFEIQNVIVDDLIIPRKTCIYSMAKMTADIICKTIALNNGIEYVAGLVPMPYGEGNTSMQLVNAVIDSLLQGKSPKLVEGNNLYDIVYIEDIARGFVAIGENGKNGRRYYLGHRKLQTFREWMLAIRDIINPEVELKFGEYIDEQKIDYDCIDLDALYRDTGWECMANFRTTIKQTAEWYKEFRLEETSDEKCIKRFL